MNQKSETLSEPELLSLKNELRLADFTWFTGFLMAMVSIQVMIFSVYGSYNILKPELFAVSGCTVLTVILNRIFTKALRTEILEGRKTIVFKEIGQKYDFMDRHDRFSREQRKFILVAGGTKYVVTEEQYRNADVSDMLKIQRTPLREQLIGIEIVKKEAT